MPKLSHILLGRKEKNKQKSLLTPEQQQIETQLINAANQRGSGGGFGESADYFRDILSQDPGIQQQLSSPEINRYQQETVPGLSEQFGGLGRLSNESFNNASKYYSDSLSEKLRAIRAGLRQNAASGLSQMGQFALQPRVENIHRPETGGFVQAVAKGVGLGVGNTVGSLNQQSLQRTPMQAYNNQSQVQNDVYRNSQSAIAPNSAMANPVAWRK